MSDQAKSGQPHVRSAHNKSTGEEAVDRRTLLLKAGEEIFTHRPYDEVSAQEIAEHAGVAYGLLFHYFGNKRGFFLEVIERAAADSLAISEANDEPDPVRWVRRELRIALATFESHPSMLLNLIHGSIGAEAEVQEVVWRLRQAGMERVMAKLQPERRSNLLEASLSGWIASITEIGLHWIESGATIPKKHLEEVLIASLNATLRTVAALDKQAKFDPERFAR